MVRGFYNGKTRVEVSPGGGNKCETERFCVAHYVKPARITLAELSIERYKLMLQVVSPAPVNRELAAPKRLFNLAKQWSLYRGRNPVKGVRFLDENNLKLRTLSEGEERALLSRLLSVPADPVTFAINT